MIRIAITAEAFEAIARTLPFGSVNFEAGVDDDDERFIWLEPRVVDRLKALRRPARATATSSCGSRAAASRAKVKTQSRDAPLTAT